MSSRPTENESNTQPLKAVLFDCDGVLVDSEPAMAEIAALALRDCGAAADPADFKPYIGTDESVYFGKVAAKYGVPCDAALVRRIYDKYAEAARQYVHPTAGIQELLARLKSAGCRLAVASSADQVKLETNLAVLGLPSGVFDAIVCGGDTERRKPFPDIYLLAARRCGVGPENCTVVEDAVSGIHAGKAAGMFCIGYTSANTAGTLLAAGADAVVDDIRDVWLAVNGQQACPAVPKTRRIW